MVMIAVGSANFLHLVGHGLNIEVAREIAPGISVSPDAPTKRHFFRQQHDGRIA